MVDPITAGAVAFTVKALEKPLSDIYNASTGGMKALATKWVASGKRDALVQTISEAEKVRTIFSSTPVSLSSFYYPSRVSELRSSKAPKLVTNLQETCGDKNLLILGTVGQGKSILMRHLCIEELKGGRKIPIFIELRTLEAKDSIRSKLIEQLEVLGFDGVNDAIFTDLLDQGCFVFFLDGFDELKRELALAVQTELKKLMKRAPKTRWAISSRPGSLSAHVSELPSLHTVQIEPLADYDFDPFLKALNVAPGARERLVNAIMSSPGEIKGVLKTPLMLTLLNLTFGTSTHIPDTLHEFYESMFLFLVFRHDETKPGYTRQKATQLSNAELQEAFEYFCFLSKDHGVSLSEEDFSLCAKNAAKLSDLSFTPEGFRSDLSETVCLMQGHGIRTAFIHRSIQEFFTAFFIKHLGKEETVKNIYERISGPAVMAWQQELRFLEQIDKHRYIEYYRLPGIRKFLSSCEFSATSRTGVTQAAFVRYLGTQPIIAITNSSSPRANKRSFLIVVLSGDANYSSFTLDLGNILLMDGHIGESMDGEMIKRLKTKMKHVVKQLPKEDLQTALNKFRDYVKKIERERVRLDKLLAERKENFRDILLAAPKTSLLAGRS